MCERYNAGNNQINLKNCVITLYLEHSDITLDQNIPWSDNCIAETVVDQAIIHNSAQITAQCRVCMNLTTCYATSHFIV